MSARWWSLSELTTSALKMDWNASTANIAAAAIACLFKRALALQPMAGCVIRWLHFRAHHHVLMVVLLAATARPLEAANAAFDVKESCLSVEVFPDGYAVTADYPLDHVWMRRVLFDLLKGYDSCKMIANFDLLYPSILFRCH